MQLSKSGRIGSGQGKCLEGPGGIHVHSQPNLGEAIYRRGSNRNSPVASFGQVDIWLGVHHRYDPTQRQGDKGVAM